MPAANFSPPKPGEKEPTVAVNVRQLFPLQQARERRVEVGRYLRLDGGRSLIAAVLVLVLMSLISLGQTGRLASIGYQVSQLQRERTVLLREQSRLHLQLSRAQALNQIRTRADAQGLRPLTPDQVRYTTITPILEEPQAAEP
jgi:hypothetical protein